VSYIVKLKMSQVVVFGDNVMAVPQHHLITKEDNKIQIQDREDEENMRVFYFNSAEATHTAFTAIKHQLVKRTIWIDKYGISLASGESISMDLNKIKVYNSKQNTGVLLTVQFDKAKDAEEAMEKVQKKVLQIVAQWDSLRIDQHFWSKNHLK
jgi:hypothetical protein